MSSFREEAAVYLDHVAALLVPGRKVKAHEVLPDHLAATGDLEGWNDEDLDLLIEECRRSLDGQQARFDRMRTTAQIVLPLATALLVVVGSELRSIVQEPTAGLRYMMYAVWGVGSLLILLAGLGAGATLSVRSDFGAIMPTVVSQLRSPIRKKLAAAYTGQVVTGETTVGTRITVIRDAITLLSLGGVAHLALWLVDVL